MKLDYHRNESTELAIHAGNGAIPLIGGIRVGILIICCIKNLFM